MQNLETSKIEDPMGEETKPIEVRITNLDELRIAVYEGVLMANNATDIDKWHILSKMKYNGKGWSEIARTLIDIERKKQNEYKKPSKGEVNKKAREVQRSIEAHRKHISGVEEEQDDG